MNRLHDETILNELRDVGTAFLIEIAPQMPLNLAASVGLCAMRGIGE
ncbi:hypothetical protein HUU62_27370 [Rhodoferax sp. 4810]|uniref:Uncharacterized protein n=1 Tax=Thiospirillum jenense TaxID=1653858 RepID=A0A839HB34_9GAMM|nr:hypothetical protein [Thiospirillum jenense]MBB1078117.1 hypothetical protein [Rhodoferax jenense]MBB1125951.1 hypothetical protein [Thiospirillum jenense]